MESTEEVLVRAIQGRRRVRLVYKRKADEVVSIHEVAPIDIRGGWTVSTAETLYLWAWCFAEDKAEMHLMQRIRAALALEGTFDPDLLLRRWPIQTWPIPEEWSVQRPW